MKSLARNKQFLDLIHKTQNVFIFIIFIIYTYVKHLNNLANDKTWKTFGLSLTSQTHSVPLGIKKISFTESKLYSCWSPPTSAIKRSRTNVKTLMYFIISSSSKLVRNVGLLPQMQKISLKICKHYCVYVDIKNKQEISKLVNVTLKLIAQLLNSSRVFFFKFLSSFK